MAPSPHRGAMQWRAISKRRRDRPEPDRHHIPHAPGLAEDGHVLPPNRWLHPLEEEYRLSCDGPASDVVVAISLGSGSHSPILGRFRPDMQERNPLPSRACRNQWPSYPRSPSSQSTSSRLSQSPRGPTQSLTCPAVTDGVWGGHWRSQIACSFVCMPPLVRPVRRLCPPLCAQRGRRTWAHRTIATHCDFETYSRSGRANHRHVACCGTSENTAPDAPSAHRSTIRDQIYPRSDFGPYLTMAQTDQWVLSLGVRHSRQVRFLKSNQILRF